MARIHERARTCNGAESEYLKTKTRVRLEKIYIHRRDGAVGIIHSISYEIKHKELNQREENNTCRFLESVGSRAMGTLSTAGGRNQLSNGKTTSGNQPVK